MHFLILAAFALLQTTTAQADFSDIACSTDTNEAVNWTRTNTNDFIVITWNKGVDCVMVMGSAMAPGETRAGPVFIGHSFLVTTEAEEPIDSFVVGAAATQHWNIIDQRQEEVPNVAQKPKETSSAKGTQKQSSSQEQGTRKAVAKKESSSQEKGSQDMLIIIVASIAGVVLILALVSLAALLWRRKNQRVNPNHNKMFRSSSRGEDPEAATDENPLKSNSQSGAMSNGASWKKTEAVSSMPESRDPRKSYAFSESTERDSVASIPVSKATALRHHRTVTSLLSNSLSSPVLKDEDEEIDRTISTHSEFGPVLPESDELEDIILSNYSDVKPRGSEGTISTHSFGDPLAPVMEEEEEEEDETPADVHKAQPRGEERVGSISSRSVGNSLAPPDSLLPPVSPVSSDGSFDIGRRSFTLDSW
jgi:hypothetical protein